MSTSVAIRTFIDRAIRKFRQLACLFLNGKHELLRAHDDTRLFQRCVCGYETAGITIDRRDRRLHLVVNNHTQPRREQLRSVAAGYAPARARASR
jgi:hypothetical protein